MGTHKRTLYRFLNRHSLSDTLNRLAFIFSAIFTFFVVNIALLFLSSLILYGWLQKE